MRKVQKSEIVLLLIIVAGIAAVTGWAVKEWKRSTNIEADRAIAVALKSALISLKNYREVNGEFPPLSFTGSDGEPTVSWRLACAPFVDAGAASHPNLKECWNCEENAGITSVHHPLFCYGMSPESSMASIYAFDCKGSLLRPENDPQPLGPTPSSLIVLVYSNSAKVNWGQPGDIECATQFSEQP